MPTDTQDKAAARGYVATNAASSGVKLDRKTIKALGKRSDVPGLIWLAQWAVLLGITGYLFFLSLGWPERFRCRTVSRSPRSAITMASWSGSAIGLSG